VPSGEVAVLPAPYLLAEALAVPLLVAPRVDGEDLGVAIGRRFVVRMRVGKLPELLAERYLRRVVKEGYSEDPKELKANHGRDDLRECIDGAAVIGVEYPPGLDMGDCLLNDPPDLVYPGVELYLPV
jgi:hypothetical protein